MKSKKVDDNKSKQPKYATRNKEDKQISNKKKTTVKNGQRPKDSSPKNTYRWLNEHMKRYPTSLIIQFSSVQLLKCVQLFATPWTAARQASLSITNSQSLLKFMSIESVMPTNHLILCCPLLLLPSTFPSIRVFSNKLVLHIRWPKYWSFSFSISPSNECSRLTSLKIDWLDLPAVQRTLKSIPQHHNSKVSILLHSAFFMTQLTPIHDYWMYTYVKAKKFSWLGFSVVWWW